MWVGITTKLVRAQLGDLKVGNQGVKTGESCLCVCVWNIVFNNQTIVKNMQIIYCMPLNL